jgi:hypothetical protein
MNQVITPPATYFPSTIMSTPLSAGQSTNPFGSNLKQGVSSNKTRPCHIMVHLSYKSIQEQRLGWEDHVLVMTLTNLSINFGQRKMRFCPK